MSIFIRSAPKLHSRKLGGFSIKKFSTIPSQKIVRSDEFDKHIHDFENLTTVLNRKKVKLPQREPFVKNLFLGKVDTEILTYPELQKDEVDELERTINLLRNILREEDDPNNVRETFLRMKRLKCLGLQCSSDIGSRELNQTQHCRFNEILLNSPYRYAILNNELCIYTLSKYGTDDQKNKYLQKLLNGEIISSISIANNSDTNSTNNLKAFVTENFDSYVLKGEKKYILCGNNADLFIIFVQNGDVTKNSLNDSDFTAFLIDRNTPGISIETIDVNERTLEGTSNIVFNDVKVSKNNIIGDNEAIGRSIMSNVFLEYHLNMSVINLNIMKKLVNCLAEDLLGSSPPGEEIHQTEAITSVISEVLSYVYMVESMVYMTSGLMSTYEDQDCDIESLITRTFSTELALKSTKCGLSLLGTASLSNEHFCQKIHREALSQYISFENQNMTKLMIGLLGIQYSGKNLGNTVKKLRNPLFHGSFVLQKIWQNRRQSRDDPDLTLELKNYFHPSCQEAANEIEYCVLRLQYATESFLSKYGIDVLNQHNHLRRLSESVMSIFAMIACLSRASRSYCIGLENNESEILIANLVCQNSYKHVRALLNDVIEECLIMDDPLKVLSENLYRKKNYYFAHPLTRNF